MQICPQASANAAFDSAAVYYQAGWQVLGPNGWNTDQRLMLDLCSEGARTFYICGDFVTSKSFVDEVIRQDNITVDDKYIAYDVKVKAHYAANEFNDALDTAFLYNKQLGMPTLKNKPVGPLIIIKEFIKTSRKLGKRTSKELVSLPELTDERVAKAQRMHELATNSSFIAQPSLFPLLVFLLMRASLKHGINASSCDAFGGYGVILW